MDKLRKLTAEYFALVARCDGKAEIFAALHPLAKDLEKRVTDFQRKAKSQEVRYFAGKLRQDVSDMELRFWKYTIS